MHVPCKHWAKWKKPVTKDHILTWWFHLYEMSWIGKFIETESRSSGCLGLGWIRRWGWNLRSTEFLYEVTKNILKWTLVMAVHICKYTKIHSIVHFKWVNCMVCELHLIKAFFKNYVHLGQPMTGEWYRTSSTRSSGTSYGHLIS